MLPFSGLIGGQLPTRRYGPMLPFSGLIGGQLPTRRYGLMLPFSGLIGGQLPTRRYGPMLPFSGLVGGKLPTRRYGAAFQIALSGSRVTFTAEYSFLIHLKLGALNANPTRKYGHRLIWNNRLGLNNGLDVLPTRRYGQLVSRLRRFICSSSGRMPARARLTRRPSLRTSRRASGHTRRSSITAVLTRFLSRQGLVSS